MISPIFNLSYYLIGMYFGLINFSVQRGIFLHKMEISESYSIIEMIGKYQEQDNNDIKENDYEDNEINNIKLDNLDLESNSSGINKSFSLYSEKDKSENEINKSQRIKRKKKKKSKKENKSKEKEQKDLNLQNNDLSKELNEKIEEMPFLISPIHFLNIHQRNNRSYLFRLMIFLFSIFIIISMFIQLIIIYSTRREKGDNNQIFNFEDIISDYGLNIFYVFDIELVVFIINWIFFVMYSRSNKTADIFDFLNNQYWLFFVKSYFSFTVISTPIIIYVFYQSETVIELNLGNIFLYFSIDIIFIFIGNILFYSFFEFPFKKIFKSYFLREEIFDFENEENIENESFEKGNEIDEEISLTGNI